MGAGLSYRAKVPLALTAVALIAGVLVAATTYRLVDRHVQANAEAETRRLAATLARALTEPVLRNDVWQAFQLLRATMQVADGPSDASVEIVLLDAQGRVFASPTPRQHPLGRHMAQLPADLAAVARPAFERQPPQPVSLASQDDGSLVLAVPIVGDEDAVLGVVLARHPRALTDSQRATVVGQLVLLGAAAVVFVAAAGALLGVRMVAPLARLREAMQTVPRPETRDAVRLALDEVSRRGDEVGELGRGFASMLDQIAAQRELERHMLQAERMASIGQLTAGIAHEVNNPLGGMRAAIENRRLRGGLDAASERTLGLLERGLQQVHATVQALLNEARSERHALTDTDLHDLQVLLTPEAAHVRCRLDWQPRPPATAALPAVPVRQVLLNLTLNAIAAAGRDGQVRVWSRDDSEAWQVWVGNTGPALDDARLAQLTQGTERAEDGRLGLGLWITARILHTLGGRLALAAPDGDLATVLRASFPVPAVPDPGPPAP